jgi:Putative DNA-binding domain
VAGVREEDVLNELGKQLSAFANVGGGRIIYGLNDAGSIDNGGIARSVKGRQSTKDWLEDVIPTLTDFEIVGFNVHEIQPKAIGSVIQAGKSIYIVDVPNSSRAPHQSKRDLKYYVRLGGKSHPASHRLIEDIRNRQKHPMLDFAVTRLEVIGLPQFDVDHVKFEGGMGFRFHIRLSNLGSIMAKNVCFHLQGPDGFQWETFDDRTVRPRGVSSSFWELIGPLYPGMEIDFWISGSIFSEVGPPRAKAPYGGPWFIGSKVVSEVRFPWKLFADSAPTREGVATLEELDFGGAARRAIDKHPLGRKILQIYQFL